MSFNKLKDTTIYGTFKVTDASNNNANTILDRNLSVGGNINGSSYITSPNLATPSTSLIPANHSVFYSNVGTPHFSFNNGSLIDTYILATTADLQYYIPGADIVSTYLKISDAETIYLSIEDALSNYIQKGGDIPLNNNAKLSFPSSYPSTAVNNNNSGIAFYWNNSNQMGETDLLCYGGTAKGGLTISTAGNTTAPFTIAAFLRDYITFFYAPEHPTNTDVGDISATTQYVDDRLSNYANTSSNNTFTETQTFNGNINFKNQLIPSTGVPQVQSINWYIPDPNSNLIGKIETDKAASSMNFFVESTEIARGFMFSGGSINSEAQQQTWFISANNAGNSYTPSGKNLGSSNNSTSARWDKLTTYGGAQYYSSNWDATNGIFTASIPGTYYFQLCIFNNGTSTSGRWLQAGGTCILGTTGTQYLSFNQSYLTSDGAMTLSLMYYMNATQTIYFYCPVQSPTLYYGDGHTTLQIIKML